MKLNSDKITEHDLMEMGFTNVFGSIYQINIGGKFLKVQKFFNGIKILNK